MRYYTNSTIATTLSAGISNTATTMAVADLTGLPTNYPYTLILDIGTASEELVEVTGGSGGSLTVTRGVDNSVALAHAPNAAVTHGVSARDYADSRKHEAANLGVHGIAASSQVVGTTDTQTLTNKTLTAPVLQQPTFDSLTNFPNSIQGIWTGFVTVMTITDGGDVFGGGYAQATVNFPVGRFTVTPVTQVTVASGLRESTGVTARVTADSATSVSVRADFVSGMGMIGKTVRFNITAIQVG